MERPKIPDLSHWTGKVDFNKMKSQGIIAVIIKASQQVEDDKFATYWKDAKEAGLLRGAYHYIDFRVSEITQANLFCSLLQSDPGELPPILDLEMNPSILSTLQVSMEKENDPHPYNLVRSLKGEQISKTPKQSDLFGASVPFTNTRSKTFLNIVESKLKKVPMIYSGYFYMNDYVHPDASWARYPFWLAWYNSESVIKTPSPWKSWTLWQYTDRANGPTYGVESLGLDMSYYNGTETDLFKFSNSTPVVSPPQEYNYVIYGGNPNLHYPNITSPVSRVMMMGTKVFVDDMVSNKNYAHITKPYAGWIWKYLKALW